MELAKPTDRDFTQTFDPDGDVTLLLYRIEHSEGEGSTSGSVSDHMPPPSSEETAEVVEEGIQSLILAHSPALGSEGGSNVLEVEREPNIRWRVSSKLLSLVSPVFKSMLDGRFSEGQELRENSSVSIELPEDDADAFEILLAIIHHKHHLVARNVRFRMLRELAILVDKYELRECVAIYSDSWIDALAHTIEDADVHDLVDWICICWIFRRDNEFQLATKLAQTVTDGENLKLAADGTDLPVPYHVLEKIEAQRKSEIERIVACIQNHLDIFASNTVYHCSSSVTNSQKFICDATLLGTLQKSASKLGLHPPPQPPYEGHCFDAILKRLPSELVVESNCRQDYYDTRDAGHGVKETILQTANEIKGLQVGPIIREMKKGKKKSARSRFARW